MRIDLNAQATNGPEKAASSSNASAAAAKSGSDGGARTDTAQFLLGRIRTQALATEPAQQIEAGKLKVEALRKVLSEGFYDVPAELIAGAIVAQAKVFRA